MQRKWVRAGVIPRVFHRSQRIALAVWRNTETRAFLLGQENYTNSLPASKRAWCPCASASRPQRGGNIISLAVALASFLFMARPFQCYPLPSNDTTARIASSHTANKRKKTESSHCDGLCLAPASWQLTAASRAQCPHPLMGLQTLSK